MVCGTGTFQLLFWLPWLFADNTDEILRAGADIILQPDEQILNCNMPDSDGVAYESLEGEAVAMIEESPIIDGTS